MNVKQYIIYFIDSCLVEACGHFAKPANLDYTRLTRG